LLCSICATSRLFSLLTPSPAALSPLSLRDALPILSPSSRKVCRPRATSFASTKLAMVDLPAPDRPVNHSTAGRWPVGRGQVDHRSEEHTSELQSLRHLVCRLLLEKKKTTIYKLYII